MIDILINQILIVYIIIKYVNKYTSFYFYYNSELFASILF